MALHTESKAIANKIFLQSHCLSKRLLLVSEALQNQPFLIKFSVKYLTKIELQTSFPFRYKSKYFISPNFNSNGHFSTISHKFIHNYFYFRIYTWHKVLKVATGNNHFLKKAIIVSHYFIIYKHLQHIVIFTTFHPFLRTMNSFTRYHTLFLLQG